MKKILSGMLVLALVLCLAACGGDAAVGKYGFSHMESMGVSFDAEALEAFGIDSSAFMLEMKSGGTFVMTALVDDDTETAEGTWEKNGDGYILTIDGEAVNAVYDPKEKTMTLTMEGDDGIMVFKK
ncbi:hypothetical protein LJB76_02740 [Clostridia bacterium OttesenSCG-928-O13]|nr:hypothetical protein [Clostridia bacterium OttesenSCG-928-O13]